MSIMNNCGSSYQDLLFVIIRSGAYALYDMLWEAFRFCKLEAEEAEDVSLPHRIILTMRGKKFQGS